MTSPKTRTGVVLAATAAIAVALLAIPLSAQQDGWTDLLPDAELTDWTRIPIPPVAGLESKMQWSVDPAERTITCSGDGGHEMLRYNKELGDFILEVDWRFTPLTPDEQKYNSGVLVRTSRYGEIWHQAQTGLTGGFIFASHLVDGSLKFVNLVKEMKENRIKPAGEWNHYEIRAEGDRITLAVNGEVVSEMTGCALRRGYIGLEAEGYDITFRNIRLRTLD